MLTKLTLKGQIMSYVSIPLFSGLHADSGDTLVNESSIVSIPLFSGLHADHEYHYYPDHRGKSQSLCFQGFMLTKSHDAIISDDDLSQSLCFQGFMLT